MVFWVKVSSRRYLHDMLKPLRVRERPGTGEFFLPRSLPRVCGRESPDDGGLHDGTVTGGQVGKRIGQDRTVVYLWTVHPDRPTPTNRPCRPSRESEDDEVCPLDFH